MTASSSNIFQQRILQRKEEKPQESIFQKRIQERDEKTDSWWDAFLEETRRFVSPTKEEAAEEEKAYKEGLGQFGRAVIPSVVGLPGDIYQAVKSFAAPQDEEERKKIEEERPFTTRLAQKGLESLPTSESLRKRYDIATEGKFLPKTPGQERFQEISGDAILLLGGPTSMARKGLVKGVLRPVGAAIAGTLSREGAEALGAGEKGQTAAKIGGIFFTSAFNPKAAKQYYEKLFSDAATLRGNATVDATIFLRKLDDFETELKKGIKTAPAKKVALDAIDEMRTNVNPQGQIALDAAEQMKKDLNDITTQKIFDPEFKGKEVKKTLKKNFASLGQIASEPMLEYGKTNPEYLKTWKEANLAFGGFAESTKLEKYISSVVRKLPFKPLVYLAIGHSFPGAITKGFAGYGIVKQALKGYKFAHRLTMNPALRRNYISLMKAAVKEDAAAVAKYAESLGKEIEKDQGQE